MLEIDDWNACAVPWNEPVMVSGILICATAPSRRSTAWLSETPGARLNDNVTDGTWPRWLIVDAPTERSKCATADSGTSWPLLECTYNCPSTAGSFCRVGSTCISTQYWSIEV